MLNASISRSYQLALSTNQTMTVVATDGGLTQRPQPVRSLRVGMAERYELVIDFSKYGTGQQVILKNLGLKNNVNFPSTAQHHDVRGGRRHAGHDEQHDPRDAAPTTRS